MMGAILHGTAISADQIAMYLSTTHAAISVYGGVMGGWSAFYGGPQTAAAGALAGYSNTMLVSAPLFQPLEGFLGIYSLAANGTKDVLLGNSGFDLVAGDWVVGGDTAFATSVAIVGFANIEPVTDTLINVGVVNYNAAGPSWEVRLGPWCPLLCIPRPRRK